MTGIMVENGGRCGDGGCCSGWVRTVEDAGEDGRSHLLEKSIRDMGWLGREGM